jgi:hypothetical protein
MDSKQQVWVAHYEIPASVGGFGDTDWETYAAEDDAREVFSEWCGSADVLAGATVTLRRVDGWSVDRVVAHDEQQLDRADRGWTCWLWDLNAGGVVVESVVVK